MPGVAVCLQQGVSSAAAPGGVPGALSGRRGACAHEAAWAEILVQPVAL